MAKKKLQASGSHSEEERREAMAQDKQSPSDQDRSNGTTYTHIGGGNSMSNPEPKFDIDLVLNRTPISDCHSINRVKRALSYTERPHFNKQRAAALHWKCRRWLGYLLPPLGP